MEKFPPGITTFRDVRIPIEELQVFNGGVNPLTEGWLPCKNPERPLDRNAAIKHVIKGRDCRSCEIAKDAYIRMNQPYGVIYERRSSDG